MRSVRIKNKQTTKAIVEIVPVLTYEDDDHTRGYSGNEVVLHPGEEHKFVLPSDEYYQLWQVMSESPLEWAWDSILFGSRNAITYTLEDINEDDL